MLKTVKCNIVICDGCGKKMGEDGDYVVHCTTDEGQPDDVREWLESYEWTTYEDKHYDDQCEPLCTCEHARSAHDDDGECEGDGDADCGCKQYRPPEIVNA